MANNPLQFNILIRGCPESQPSVKHFFFFFLLQTLSTTWNQIVGAYYDMHRDTWIFRKQDS